MARSKQKSNGAPETAGIATSESGRDLVATRAYQLYLARGAGDGHELDDWLTAERELSDRKAQKPRNTIES